MRDYEVVITRLCSESTNLRQRVKPQPKVIRNAKHNFRIYADSDPDACRITPKMLWIHYLIDISHFAECRENQR